MHAFAARFEVYNPNNAVNYARQWATSRNASYPVLDANSSQGGDCTNFASQVLAAGGWRNTATTNSTSDMLWWFNSKTSYSQTWSTAHGFFRHMNGGKNPQEGFGPSYESWTGWSGAQSVNYGDIVFADWTGDNVMDHTMVVTGFKRKFDGTVEPRFTYHSTDRKDFPLSDLIVALGTNATKVKFYRFGALNVCQNPQSYQIF